MADATAPRLRPPPGACDTHMHIYESGYPIADTAIGDPPVGPLADYLQEREKLGLTRNIVVQPSHYGKDNRCTMEAVAKLGDDARAVVVVDTAVQSSELQDLTDRGARGIRFHMLPGGALPWDIMEEMAGRVADVGWHVQLQLDGGELSERYELLRRLPTPIVIDHIGRFHDAVPPNHEAFQTLLRLVDGGAWVKLSGPYITSKSGPPDYTDISTLARELARRAPERMLWATNWPHPGEDPRPDNRPLLDILMDWAGDEVTVNRVLVDNPAELYGF